MVQGPVDQGQKAGVTYAYGDIDEGFGYTTYYLYTANDSSGTSYNMGKTPLYSYHIELNDKNTTTYTFYSGEMNIPKVLSGTSIFSFFSSDVGTTDNLIYTIKLYHYDGSTSTQIGSTWTSETWAIGGAYRTPVAVIAKIASTTPVNFAPGDQLKLTVTATVTDEDDNYHLFGVDPMNRDGSEITPSGGVESSQFICLIPWKLFT